MLNAETQSKTVVEWDAEAYHRLSDMQFDIAMTFLGALNIAPDATVLDAGCGSGRITKELLKRLPQGGVLDVDLAHGMVAMARDIVAPQPGQTADFRQADLQTFCQPASVDGIFSSMALHFVHDHDLLFKNLAKTLRPGGWLAVQFGASRNKQQVTMQLLHLLREAPFATYLDGRAFDFQGADADQTRKSLEGAGFIDAKVEEIESAQVAEQSEKMIEFMRTTMIKDCLAQLPTEALRTQFQQSAEAAMVKAFQEPFSYIRVTARTQHLH